MKKIILFVMFLWALPGDAIFVREIVLELGSETVFPLENCKPISAFTSSDSIAPLTVSGNEIRIRALEFGSATITIFCSSGELIYRILVPTQSIVSPINKEEAGLPGSRGAIGIRAAFRSTVGLFDSRVSEEEFFRYSEDHQDFRQSAAIASSDPIYYPSPKPARTIDQLFWEYRQLSGRRLVRVGDFDPLQKGVAGGIRGARVDQVFGSHSLNMWGGILRSGVGHPLTGQTSSPIIGYGHLWEFTPNTKIAGHILTFERNDGLALPESGSELGVRPSFQLGPANSLNLGLILDKTGKMNADAQWNLELSPFSFSLSATHSPSQLAVYTLPTRFSENIDLFDVSGAWHFSEQSRVAAGLGRVASFASIDGFPGTTRLDSAHINWSTNQSTFKWRTLGNYYKSQFSPYSQGFSQTEEGGRVEGEIDWELTPKNYLTMTAVHQDIRASRDLMQYENQQFAVGWKKELYSNREDNLHVELGASKFKFPLDPAAGGTFLMSRLATLWDAGFMKLDGMIQGETRMDAGSSHTLRIQTGLVFTPTSLHEIRLALSHNMDWTRNVYSNFRGFFILYTMKFGDGYKNEPVAAHWEKARVSGKVYLEKRHSEMGEKIFENIENAVIELKSEVSDQKTVTDSEGRFEFTGVSSGTKKLVFSSENFDRLKSIQGARLVSTSERNINLTSGQIVHEDFVLNDQAEIRGIIFEDLNGNHQIDSAEPLAVSGIVTWETDEAHRGSVESEDGRFKISNLSEGNYTLQLAPGSLATGYGAGSEIKVKVKKSSIENVVLITRAERTISGRLFHDRNGSRIWGVGQLPIDGVAVRFGRFSTKTGEGGQYIFRRLPPMKGRVEYGNCRSNEIILEAEPKILRGIEVPCATK